MKTRLLKRLRREAEKTIGYIQLEMRDMGFGRNVWRVDRPPIYRDVYSAAELQVVLYASRRDYILGRIRELRNNKHNLTKTL